MNQNSSWHSFTLMGSISYQPSTLLWLDWYCHSNMFYGLVLHLLNTKNWEASTHRPDRQQAQPVAMNIFGMISWAGPIPPVQQAEIRRLINIQEWFSLQKTKKKNFVAHGSFAQLFCILYFGFGFGLTLWLWLWNSPATPLGHRLDTDLSEFWWASSLS